MESIGCCMLNLYVEFVFVICTFVYLYYRIGGGRRKRDGSAHHKDKSDRNFVAVLYFRTMANVNVMNEGQRYGLLHGVDFGGCLDAKKRVESRVGRRKMYQAYASQFVRLSLVFQTTTNKQ